VDSTQKNVNGKVRRKLYKGSISSAGVTSPNSLYNASIASFTTGELYNHADSKGFVKLYGLPILVRSLMEQEKKGVKTPRANTSNAGAKSVKK
jgi:argininosuccinate synthase